MNSDETIIQQVQKFARQFSQRHLYTYPTIAMQLNSVYNAFVSFETQNLPNLIQRERMKSHNPLPE